MNSRKTKTSKKNYLNEMLHIAEPMLEFGHKQQMAYPRDGLFLFGPAGTPSHIPVTRYGVIGTREGVRRFRVWSERMANPIAVPEPGGRSKAVEAHHVMFPGFSSAFKSEWPKEPHAIIDDIDAAEIDRSLHLTNRHEATCLYNDRLPVTIRFANEVGDVLISAPLEGEPRLPFKFYI